LETSDGVQALVMELVQGEDLSRRIMRGAIPFHEALPIARQIAEALEAAHEQGIIHRDLKPANIMYNPSTQRAILLDFGIARDQDLKPEERLTRTGFFVGTLQYVAPEALSGELVNQQADVYSLATIAYYLLTGTLPYTGRSPRELFQQLLTQPPLPLNQAVKGLKFSPAVEQVVMSGLERDLAKRSKSVDEFSQRFCTAAREEIGKKGGFLSNIFGR
jgi:serine/threonine-protein kinase